LCPSRRAAVASEAGTARSSREYGNLEAEPFRAPPLAGTVLEHFPAGIAEVMDI
jgi:hypothetical protein